MKRVVQLCEIELTSKREGPARFLDSAESCPEFVFETFSIVSAPSEEDKEAAAYNLSERPDISVLDRLKHILREKDSLGQADVVICQSGEYFWFLVLLAKFRLLPRSLNIVRMFYRDGGLKKRKFLLGQVCNAWPLMVTKSQEEKFKTLGVRYFPFAIDTNWFSPAQNWNLGPPLQILVPGNVRRDEELVRELIEAGDDRKWFRVGRRFDLDEIYRREVSAGKVVVEVNATHEKYREILKGSSVVVLPIQECDEPAGLTAALESLACGIPVVTSEGYGMDELHGSVGDALQIMTSNHIEDWNGAIERARSLPIAIMKNASSFVAATHGMTSAQESVTRLLGFLESGRC